MGQEVAKYDGFNLPEIQAYVGVPIVPAIKPQSRSTVPPQTVDSYGDVEASEKSQEVRKQNLCLRSNPDGLSRLDIFDYRQDKPEDVGALTRFNVDKLNQDHYTDIALNESGLKRPPAYFDTSTTANSKLAKDLVDKQSSLDFDTLA